jgi:GTP-binding protein
MNYYRRSLEIMGTPIRIHFHNSENPFEGKVNKMTLSQGRKRDRVLSMMKNRKK